MNMNAPRSLSGRRDAGPWRFLRFLGRGGEGEVFLAEHRRTRERASVKLIDSTNVPLDVIRPSIAILQRLSQTAAQPNLARLLDARFGPEESWIASEYVAGTSLAALLQSDEGLDPFWAVNMLIDGAYGLAALHKAGVLHGDVKPPNLMLGTDGRSRWIDFSSIRAISEGHEGPREEAWAFHGTAAYASPEQLRGVPQGPKSDLWGFGVLAWEALTGRRLFQGIETYEVYGEMLDVEERIMPPSALRPEIPKEVDEIIVGLLRLKVQDRVFENALELAEALERLALRQRLGCFHRGSDRRRMRQDLAETSYWKCVNLVEEGAFSQAETLISCLRDLPATVRARYDAHLGGVIRRVLRRHPAFLSPSFQCGKTFDRVMGELRQLLHLANALKDRDSAALVSTRIVSLLKRLPDGAERLPHLQRIMLAEGRESLPLARESFRLAQDLKQDGYLASILPMYLGLLEKEGELEPLSDLLPVATASRRMTSLVEGLGRRRLARERFAIRWVGFMTHGRFEEAFSQVLHHLGTDPGDLRAMEAFCRQPRSRGAALKARAMREELGRRAFLRGKYELARSLFLARFRHGGKDELALSYLFEMAFAEGRNVTGFESDGALVLALACEDGAEGGDFETLVESFFLHGHVEQELEPLLDVARRTGQTRVAADLQLHGGIAACRREAFVEGRRRILAGLALHPAPSQAHALIRDDDMVRRAFSAMEWLLLRRRNQNVARASGRLTKGTLSLAAAPMQLGLARS